ncbi:MAG: sugar phosphate isomerase/epimerase [Planctomycetes bacterium]|jgi:sugar phosphate isomerase/epimerase|nr:sugar phosphate isomerase/epimerase [Planctomycetota bacterium]
MSIRPLIALVLTICCAFVSAAELAIQPLTPAVVSYTYRNEFKADVPGTLDRIKALGIRDIEFSNLFGQTAENLRALLDERGLTCSSFGVSYDDLREKTDVVAANAKALGAKYVRVAWLPNRQPFTREIAVQTAQEFNAIGRELRQKYGLTYCYHNHGYEFVQDGDGTLFDLLVQKTDPADVSYELDLLWAFLPSADPAALLLKYPGRFKLLHLKDLKKGVPTGDLSGKTHPDNDVTLGTGQLDMPAIIRAAQQVGVVHYYIEDESSRTAEQVPASLEYLRSIAK